MAPSVKLVIIKTVYILVVVTSATNGDKTEWFNIISRLKEKCWHLAIDMSPNITTCAGPLLILSPWNKTSYSQQWKWDHNRLRNRLNGLVWRRENEVSRNVVLTAPSDTSNQLFKIFFGDGHIYYDTEHLFKNVVVEVHCAQPPTGAAINIFNINYEPVPTQLFDFEEIYE
ncbi:hypothetical protein CHUAL_008614 [Chamberlinius hualienensis]